MTWRRIGLLMIPCALLVTGGCWNRYQGREQMAPEHLALLQQAEQHYVSQAAKKAAFITGCPPDSVSAHSLLSNRQVVLLPHFTEYVGDVTMAIAVDACGQRLIYNVICGRSHGYAGSIKEVGIAPCDLAQEGTAAEAASSRSGDEHNGAQEAIQQQQAR